MLIDLGHQKAECTQKSPWGSRMLTALSWGQVCVLGGGWSLVQLLPEEGFTIWDSTPHPHPHPHRHTHRARGGSPSKLSAPTSCRDFEGKRLHFL